MARPSAVMASAWLAENAWYSAWCRRSSRMISAAISMRFCSRNSKPSRTTFCSSRSSCNWPRLADCWRRKSAIAVLVLVGLLRLAEVLAHLRLAQPREFGPRQAFQDLPAHLHALVEPARAFLGDELLLEGVAEVEILPIGLGETLVAHHARQHPDLRGARIGGEQLVGQRRMVGVGDALADAVVHQSGQARQHVDGRIHAPAVQLAAEYDLTLGDVAGEVRDGVGDVVAGHGQYRQLCQRTFASSEAAGALVDSGQVGVQIAGITLAAGDLAVAGGHLAQRLAVVGH